MYFKQRRGGQEGVSRNKNITKAKSLSTER